MQCLGEPGGYTVCAVGLCQMSTRETKGEKKKTDLGNVK